MEADEVHEFVEHVKEGGEKSMTYVSLVISTLAVLVAMVTVLGHRAHTEAVLMQTRAADQWNEYESRKIRVQQLESAIDLLGLLPSKDNEAVQTKLDQYKTILVRWREGLTEDAEHAHELETEVDHAETKAARFDLGEALLQISVVLASITLLTKRQMYVLAAGVLGFCGILISLSAFMVK
jgi:uncharacterized membrane protein YeiB